MKTKIALSIALVLLTITPAAATKEEYCYQNNFTKPQLDRILANKRVSWHKSVAIRSLVKFYSLTCASDEYSVEDSHLVYESIIDQLLSNNDYNN